jgi:hypothetical protein
VWEVRLTKGAIYDTGTGQFVTAWDLIPIEAMNEIARAHNSAVSAPLATGKELDKLRAEGMTGAVSDVLHQLLKGPVWDGDLASKTGRDCLVAKGFVIRKDGMNTLATGKSAEEWVRLQGVCDYRKEEILKLRRELATLKASAPALPEAIGAAIKEAALTIWNWKTCELPDIEEQICSVIEKASVLTWISAETPPTKERKALEELPAQRESFLATFHGGHHEQPELGLFQHGVNSVFNWLEKYVEVSLLPPAPAEDAQEKDEKALREWLGERFTGNKALASAAWYAALAHASKQEAQS